MTAPVYCWNRTASSSSGLRSRVAAVETLDGTLDLTDLAVYRKTGGFEALTKAMREMTPEAIVNEVSASNLRGRGGAGFPTGKKWSFLPKDGRPRYLVCNSDEAEPGTFKDRMLLENAPFNLIEGLIISAYAINAKQIFIYIRGEFLQGYRIFRKAMADAYAAGYVGKDILGSGYSVDIVAHRGAGAYICGEETALIESLEGKKGQPRLKPPFPAAMLAGLRRANRHGRTLNARPYPLRQEPRLMVAHQAQLPAFHIGCPADGRGRACGIIWLG